MTVQAPSPPSVPPITLARLKECKRSAGYWASEEALLRYATRMQAIADSFAVATALLASVTGLTVWTTLTNDPGWGAQLAVSVVAFLTAALAVIPRVRKYAEAAGQGRELASQYASVYGRLIDVVEVMTHHGSVDQDRIREIINDFDSVKKRKDQLTPYPRREQTVRNGRTDRA